MPERIDEHQAHYRILVAGRVSDAWSIQLGGMQITATEEGTGKPDYTTLERPLQDRSALMGVLNALHDLNLRLVSVEEVPPVSP